MPQKKKKNTKTVETLSQWLSDRLREGMIPHEMGVFVRSAKKAEGSRLHS
jgi:hypothetical protein